MLIQFPSSVCFFHGRRLAPSRHDPDLFVVYTGLHEAREAVEVRSWIDETDLSHQSFGVDELIEFNVIDVQLPSAADKYSILVVFNQSTVCSHTELRTEHDVKCVRGAASRFVAQLDSSDLLGSPNSLLVASGDTLRNRLAQIDRPKGYMSVIVLRRGPQEVWGQHFGQTFSQHDGSIMLVILGFSSDDQLYQIVRKLGHIEIVSRLEKIAQGVDVLHGKDEVRFASNRRSICEPARLATHTLNDEIPRGSQSVCPEIQDLFGHEIHGGEESKGEIDSPIVIVNCLGKMDHTHTLRILRQISLELKNQVRRLEGIISSDGNQRVDSHVDERIIDIPQLFGLYRILEIFRCLDGLPGVCSSGTNDDSSGITESTEILLMEDTIVLVRHQPVGNRMVILQIGVPMEEPNHLMSILQKGGSGCSDDGICRRRRPSGENQTDSELVRSRTCPIHDESIS
mmetsp:Transcript_8003/g.16088  ORF Transcript_8003/g.16088 Transcript_8003/m.16088 type:complete len:455 (-) Transcript_8003:179-1543(-)